ncbi:MAG TPA: monovalent cation:proton antiporter-2 (CPA2) family protein [Flavobacteriales bacterium]|nr:monovalent cation:proton antiporter-2 (CPA2) family protein [Flavobacteriales bacterium]
MSGFLGNAVVYLGAAVLCVPLAKRLGLGSVLGYLIAGMVIGPFALGFVGQEGKDIMHFAEFGVVIMLFLVGLELEPEMLWRMRKQVVGLGAAQVALTAVLLGAFSLLVGFYQWQAGLAAGLALAMSSTAIALQSLKEKGVMHTSAGQSSFAVLLFQDVAVIPILALLPLLASGSDHPTPGSHGLGTLSGWQRTLVLLAAVAVVIVVGRYVVVPLLRIVARTRLRELFTASALLVVVGVAAVMEVVGLSPALGTFLAGVVLANSEYRHELESDLDPFKGLLLGLFFMAVGASINFDLIVSSPGLLISVTFGVVAVKILLLAIIGKLARLGPDQNMIFSVGLGQVGEFAFVLLTFIAQLRILDTLWVDTLMAVTAMSMTLTPVLMLATERVIAARYGPQERTGREADAIQVRNRVIIAGFGHFGSTLGRLLRANGFEATILDNDSDQVDLLRKMGFKVFYGDATRHDLLEAAGAREAEILVCALTPETAPTLVETVHKHFPDLKLLVRSRNRMDAYELMDQGVLHIYRETLDSAVRMGVDVLKELGQRHYSAYRAGQNFIKYDQAALKELAAKRRDTGDYITSVREKIEEQEDLLRKDLHHDPAHGDHAWNSEELRDALKKA